MYDDLSFDLIVIGAGHAGCEATHAAERLGCRVLLVTLSLDRVAAMSCNPAIGGLGKGHIVKEIDALGGMMGLAADWSGIQFRVLNRSRGPAVRGTRSQNDMRQYQEYWFELLRHRQERITCMEGEVTALKKKGSEFVVTVDENITFASKTVIVTAGTFLAGLMHTGLNSRPGGRLGDGASNKLPGELRAFGLVLGRFKTGTCPRLDGRTIDYHALERQVGDAPAPVFSFLTQEPRLPQRPCYITHTNPSTHAIIREGIDRSPLFSGVIKGRGPRYCPSIEDKIFRFPDHDRHQIFIEPEGLDTCEVYPNGLSTSLSEDIQIDLVRSIKGLEKTEILKFGYAVEYDVINPVQLYHSLMTKQVSGLFCAGQINGTSGYEEAAGQGLIAGINAARFVQDKPPLVLGRDIAYIGVMIDDLVTTGLSEPYRMFTSRAEHRMLLREDNADSRLTSLGRSLGIVGEDRWSAFETKRSEAGRLVEYLRTAKIKEKGVTLPAEDYLKRPGTTCRDTILKTGNVLTTSAAVENTVEILVKFEGYIERERQRLVKIASMSDRKIPPDLDFNAVHGLTNEAVEKLSSVRPLTLGQASRIPGVTPATISMIVIYLSSMRGVPHETRPDA